MNKKDDFIDKALKYSRIIYIVLIIIFIIFIITHWNKIR
jgi:hypothetical protein